MVAVQENLANRLVNAEAKKTRSWQLVQPEEGDEGEAGAAEQ